VLILPPREYSKALKKRDLARVNPSIVNSDAKRIVDSYVQKNFQMRYNAFLLFMLNNSQDELLMTFTEFCTRYFPLGLPQGPYSSLPETYAESEIRDLKNFI
jgi:hypothetical protein